MNLDSATASLQMRLQQEPSQPARPLFTSEHLTAWFKYCDDVLKKVDPVAVKIASIRNDKSLSLQGQQAQYAALAPQVLKDVAPIVTKPLQDVKAAMARLTAVMFDPITAKPKGDAMVVFLREQEVRARIPKGEAEKEFLTALAAGDLETSRALLDSPGRSLISDEIKRRGEEAYAQRTNPSAFAQRASLSYFKDHLQSVVEQVRNWLLALGASPEAVQAALGEGE